MLKLLFFLSISTLLLFVRCENALLISSKDGIMFFGKVFITTGTAYSINQFCIFVFLYIMPILRNIVLLVSKSNWNKME